MRALLPLVLLAALIAAPAPGASAGARPVAVTKAGAVRGVAAHGGKVFRGVPFAAPPTGRLRWRPPQPPPRWKGVREAARPGPVCAQNPSDLTGVPAGSVSEDCLTVDVYAPAGRRANLPVMVWLHGGAFTGGSGTLYDGRRLAARGAVVVSVNYRLGAFGYLSHPGLARENAAAAGNYGLLDQLAALRWARSNAGAFGGDPSRITLFGQSAGGASVCALLTAPPARGLFQRAIIQSSPPCAARPAAEAQAQGTSFARTAGCADLACLRRKDTASVLQAAAQSSSLLTALSAWGPVAGGGGLLPVSPDRAIARGDFAKVPVIIGTDRDEGRIFAAAIKEQGLPGNAVTYHALLALQYGARAGAIAARYPLEDYGGNVWLATGAVMTDARFSCPAQATARALSRHTRVHRYEFAERGIPVFYAMKPGFPLGAFHSAELPLLFDLPKRGVKLSPGQKRLAGSMVADWTAFAAKGAPTARWPSRDVLSLSAARVFTDRRFAQAHRCGFWG